MADLVWLKSHRKGARAYCCNTRVRVFCWLDLHIFFFLKNVCVCVFVFFFFEKCVCVCFFEKCVCVCVFFFGNVFAVFLRRVTAALNSALLC